MNCTATQRGRYEVPLRGTGNIPRLSEPREAVFCGVFAVYPNKTLAVCCNTWSLIRPQAVQELQTLQVAFQTEAQGAAEGEAGLVEAFRAGGGQGG